MTASPNSAGAPGTGAKLLDRLRLPDGQPYSKAMLLTFAALVVAFSGDTFRYTIGWTGYGALVGLLVALAIVLLVRRRPQLRLRHLPLMLLLFTAWCLLSVIWSGYRIETLAGSAVQLATAFVALVTAVSLTRMQFLRTLGTAMRWLVFGSLAFELFAAIAMPAGVLPPTYLRPGVLQSLLGTDRIPEPLPGGFYWTHSELFDGGPLQGLMGNRNLLAIVALIALIVTIVELLDHMVSRWYALVASAASVAAILLTDSATAYVAGAFVLLGAALVLISRRIHRQLRWVLYSVVGACLVAGGILVVVFNNEVFALMNRSSDMSGRGSIWRAVLALGSESPVLGHGWISYWAPWLPEFHSLAIVEGMPYHQAHNAFLDVWMQVGVIGLLLFIGLVFSTLIRTWWISIDVPDAPRIPSYRPGGRPHLSAATAAPFFIMVALVVQAMTESRLLVEGAWLLLCYFAIYAKLRIQDPAMLPRRTVSTKTGPVRVVLDTQLDD
ncbi:O-antigen ligase family protein [Gulosibacter sediminis]|uniref:O-antigen ligase family protein n=1 Tax=Gulosibacter sediminis TaxID=1729695 RepID=UPI0024A80CF1|nr:O-antigen ligase family protein [Gulosibacter sediminis]